MSCVSIELGLCYDLLDVALSENPEAAAYYSDLEKIATDRDASVEDVIGLCQAHGKFLKLVT